MRSSPAAAAAVGDESQLGVVGVGVHLASRELHRGDLHRPRDGEDRRRRVAAPHGDPVARGRVGEAGEDAAAPVAVDATDEHGGAAGSRASARDGTSRRAPRRRRGHRDPGLPVHLGARADRHERRAGVDAVDRQLDRVGRAHRRRVGVPGRGARRAGVGRSLGGGDARRHPHRGTPGAEQERQRRQHAVHRRRLRTGRDRSTVPPRGRRTRHVPPTDRDHSCDRRECTLRDRDVRSHLRVTALRARSPSTEAGSPSRT